MSKFVNITDRKKLNQYLQQLDESTDALWGTMNPQQMVEHLILVTEHSYGKRSVEPAITPEEQAKKKAFLLHPETEIKQGAKSPVQAGEPPVLQHKNIEEAITALNKELDAFDNHFQKNGATVVHPSMGALSYEEWILFHSKHYTHHLKQFGLFTNE